VAENKITREHVLEKVGRGESLEGADLKGINLSGADLSGGVFKCVNFRYASLDGAILKNSVFCGANMRHAMLRNANLTGADFTGADMTHSDLRGAIIVNTKFDKEVRDLAVGISEKVFFTQKQLDSLNEASKIEINGNLIRILKGDNPVFSVIPAYRFIKLEVEGTDEARVLGKVVTEAEAREMGFEAYRDSAILGEAVYKVEPGFIGIPMRELNSVAGGGKGAAVEKKSEEKIESDMEMLSKFILEHWK
jgi:hypothetical protein